MIVILDNGKEYSNWRVVFVSLPVERLQELKDLLLRHAAVQYEKRGWFVIAGAEALTWRSVDQTQDGDEFINELQQEISDHEWREIALVEHKDLIDAAVASGIKRWKAEADVLRPLWHARCEEKSR